MTVYPGRAPALAWWGGVPGAVVLSPPRSWLGVVALGATLPLLAVAGVLRPALLAVAIAVARGAGARGEPPVPPPHPPGPAASRARPTAGATGPSADGSPAPRGGRRGPGG